MRVGLVLAGAPLFGCAQVAGITETSSPSEMIQLERVSIGTTPVIAPLDLANAPLFYDASGQGAAARAGDPGTWVSGIPHATSVVYTAPDLPKPFAHQIVIAETTTQASFLVLEHPNPQPAPTSSLMLDVTLPSAYTVGESFSIEAIGAWTHRQLAANQLTATGGTAITSTLPYSSFTARTASPPAKITSGDTVVMLRYQGNALTGALGVAPFDQTDAPSSIAGAMEAVLPTTPFNATIDPDTVAARFAVGQPANANLQLGWRLDASPGYTFGVTLGVQINAGVIARADGSFSASFSDPFAVLGWQPMLTYSSSQSRTYMVGGVTVSLGSSLVSIVDPGTALSLDLPAGFPTVIALEHMALATDGMTIALDPTQPLEVEITADRPTNTLYEATVEEIAVVGTSVTQAPILIVTSTALAITLPPATLVRGHTYVIVATAVAGGYPNVATGDLQTFALPISYGQAASAVFTVSP